MYACWAKSYFLATGAPARLGRTNGQVDGRMVTGQASTAKEEVEICIDDGHNGTTGGGKAHREEPWNRKEPYA